MQLSGASSSSRAHKSIADTTDGDSIGERVGYFVLNVAQAIFLCSWSAFWISAALIVSLVSREASLAMARKFWGPGLIWAAGARASLEGELPDFDPEQNYVFVMNHQSMFDIPMAFSFVPMNLRFFAKRILAYVPFLGWYMWRTRMVFVDRSNKRKARTSVESAVERVREGANLLTYPEGTRGSGGHIRPLKRGPFLIAARAGVAVVPIAIHGSDQLLPKGGFRLRPGRVRLAIGSPISAAGADPSDIDPFRDRVQSALAELQASLVERAST